MAVVSESAVCHSSHIIRLRDDPHGIIIHAWTWTWTWTWTWALSLVHVSSCRPDQAITHSLSTVLRYMAPEVALSKPYSHRSEAFSFATILWEMAAHERPYSQFCRHASGSTLHITQPTTSPNFTQLHPTSSNSPLPTSPPTYLLHVASDAAVLWAYSVSHPLLYDPISS